MNLDFAPLPIQKPDVLTNSTPQTPKKPVEKTLQNPSVTTISPPTPPKTTQRDDLYCDKPLPVFDMLDLPEAMDAAKFPVSAKLARRWFNGRAYTAPEDPSVFYPSDMLDTTTVSMKWLLKFTSVKRRYENLVSENSINNKDAQAALIKKLNHLVVDERLKGKFLEGNLNSFEHCSGDMQKLHQLFQFQRIHISIFNTMYRNYEPSDLTTSLGNFNLYVAIGNFDLYYRWYNRYDLPGGPFNCAKPTMTVYSLVVYAKDSYSFNDKIGKNASQYLGHWNKNGLVVVLPAAGMDAAGWPDIELGNDSVHSDEYRESSEPHPYNVLLKGVDSNRGLINRARDKDIYYCVRNRDFRTWRDTHNRGGDFVVYSDLKKYPLPKPWVINLEEIRWKSK